MDKDPSGTQNSSEQVFLDGLEAEIQNDTLEHDLDAFMNALQQRSYTLDMIIQDPDESYLLDLSETQTEIEESVEEYIEALFETPMDFETRKASIRSIFIDADYSQKTLNQFIHGHEQRYDAEVLNDSIDEILKNSNDIAIEKIVLKFIQDFGNDIPPLLKKLYPDKTNEFWTLDTMILDASLEENRLVETFNEMYRAQENRLLDIEDAKTGSREVIETHKNMISKFEDCVSVVLATKMEDSERIDLIVGLFLVTSESQDRLSYTLSKNDRREKADFEVLRDEIANIYKNTDKKLFKRRIVGAFKHEFSCDLDILLDKFGKTNP
ncbi:MAG: hypothetical protein JWN75_167 [Candidatus Saccharibacteria bacterium]|nr:hypothetical protein [Candidatus Saccharibacteria bacterium]